MTTPARTAPPTVSAGRTWVHVGAILVAIGASSGTAHAAGFATARFGGEHGSVVTTNPTALYYNPAGIGFSEGVDVFLDGNLAFRTATVNHAPAPTDPPDPSGGEGANSGSAHLFNVFGAPAFGATVRLGDFALGAGLFVPFGGQESFDQNNRFDATKFFLASAGAQRWHVIDGQQAYVYGTVGAAYRIGPLSVGAAGNVVFSSVSLERAVVPPFGDPDTANEGRSKLDVSATDGSFAAGVMLEALPERLWLGASYQSQPAVGPQTLTGTLRTSTPYSSPPASLAQSVSFHQSLPDVVRVGARWLPRDDFELRLMGDFTRWSVMRTQCLSFQDSPCTVLPDGSAAANSAVLLNLRRSWNDTYHVHAGASFWPTPGVELFAGAGFETAAVPDATLEPTFMDANNLEWSVGCRYFLAHWAHIGISLTGIQYFDRDTTGQSQLAGAQLPTRQQDAGGQYSQFIALVDFHIEKKF